MHKDQHGEHIDMKPPQCVVIQQGVQEAATHVEIETIAVLPCRRDLKSHVQNGATDELVYENGTRNP